MHATESEQMLTGRREEEGLQNLCLTFPGPHLVPGGPHLVGVVGLDLPGQTRQVQFPSSFSQIDAQLFLVFEQEDKVPNAYIYAGW